MYKKIIFLFLLILSLTPSQNLFAETTNNDVNVYFFWGEGCPHCVKAETFLEKLEKRYPEIKVYDYETWKNSENRQILVEAGKKLKADISGVPFTIVGEEYIVGYYNDAITGKEIEKAVEYCLVNQCVDIVGPLAGIEAYKQDLDPKEGDLDRAINQSGGDNKDEKIINVPFLGEMDALDLSLPMLTIIIGALDGFNPCAMWALLFLISLLLGMEDKKRMWILGTAFIVASALVYFVFMAAWLNLILFLGVIVWVRLLIGLVALLGGGYNLREYFTSPKAVCKVVGSEKKQLFFERLKSITQQKSFYLALGGIILLAFAVNLVELLCSAGLPAVYTQVLALSNLTKGQYYLYLLLYILIFMLDDLIVFFVAMTTLRVTGITAKYSHWAHLIGGILMLVIGLLLIFKPEWLMFG